MAGTLFGLGLQQQVDINGRPRSGCLLYLYEASTSIPVDSFQDFGLSVLNSNPLEADGSGRIPQFWLADGSYRARLTSADGSETIFDFDDIQAIGPSTGGGGGGGGGGSVDVNAVLLTGDFLWRPTAGTRTGFVRANARTIGSVSSGAAERANADTQALFEFLWNNFSDTLCPVSGGRVGATADFVANKTIGTLDMRGYGIFGLDDMGSSAASRLTSGTPTIAASSIGAEETSITLAEANLPAHAHSNGSLTVSTSITNGTGVARNVNTQSNLTGGGGGNYVQSVTTSTLSLANGNVSGNTADTGSNTPYLATTISPGRLGTWFIKL